MRFRIRGIDRETGRPIKPLIIQADDERGALAEAANQSIIVEAVEALPVKEPRPRVSESFGPRQKYPALRAIARLYAFAAVLAAAGSIAVACSGLILMSQGIGGMGLSLSVTSLVVGVILVITLAAAAEVIRLMIDVEANLRDIRDRLPGEPLVKTKK